MKSLLRSLLVCFLTTSALGLPPVLAAEQVRPAKLMVVEASNGETTRQFFGKVVARQSVDLAFQVGGQITRFPAIEGEVLRKGELVASLDPLPFELSLQEARLQEKQARDKAGRLEKLSELSVSKAERQNAGIQADLTSVNVRNAQYDLSRATLYTPFDAVVAKRTVANYTTVQPGTVVARLHDMSELRVEIDVPEILLQKSGADPDVSFEATFPASPHRFRLEIREVNAETSQVGQSFRLTLGMEPPEDLLILPGSSVTVFATLRESQGNATVPVSALATAPDGTVSVMKYQRIDDTQGTLAKTPVQIAVADSGEIELVSGIDAGDVIVASGANGLSDGQVVRRFTGFSN